MTSSLFSLGVLYVLGLAALSLSLVAMAFALVGVDDA